MVEKEAEKYTGVVGGVEAPETCLSHPTQRLFTDRVGPCEKNQSSHVKLIIL